MQDIKAAVLLKMIKAVVKVCWETDNLWETNQSPPPWAIIAVWRNVPKATNQTQEEGLSAVNHTCVHSANCANNRETSYHYRKTVVIGSYAN